MGEQNVDWMNVTRVQVRDNPASFLLELPSQVDADDPDGLITVPGQFIMTIPEAMELAATLLRLVVQGKPLRQGGSGEADNKPGTGMPLAEIAGWLREMGLTKAGMCEMGEREHLFGQVASLTPGVSSPQG